MTLGNSRTVILHCKAISAILLKLCNLNRSLFLVRLDGFDGIIHQIHENGHQRIVLPDGEICPHLRLHDHLQLFFRNRRSGGIQHNPDKLREPDILIFRLSSEFFLNSLDNPEIVFLDLMNLPGNVQSHLLHLLRHIPGQKLLIQPVGIAHDPLNLAGVLPHQVDFTLQARGQKIHPLIALLMLLQRQDGPVPPDQHQEAAD